MKNLRHTYFVVAMCVMLLAPALLFAQDTPSADKKDLINKFRILTGANNVRLATNISTEELFNDFSKMVINDAELSDSQKADINKSVAEAKARVDKLGKDFFGDQEKLTGIAENVIFDIYDKEFTAEELQEAIAFYSTPTGKKVANFLPELNERVQEGFSKVVIKEFQHFIQPTTDADYKMLKKMLEDAKAKK